MQRGRVPVSARIDGELLHAHRRGVQQRGHQPAHRTGDLRELGVRQSRVAQAQTSQFFVHYFLGTCPQGHHHRLHLRAGLPGHELRHGLQHDRLG